MNYTDFYSWVRGKKGVIYVARHSASGPRQGAPGRAIGDPQHTVGYSLHSWGLGPLSRARWLSLSPIVALILSSSRFCPLFLLSPGPVSFSSYKLLFFKSVSGVDVFIVRQDLIRCPLFEICGSIRGRVILFFYNLRSY